MLKYSKSYPRGQQVINHPKLRRTYRCLVPNSAFEMGSIRHDNSDAKFLDTPLKISS